MAAQQQEQWRLMVRRIKGKPEYVQRRLEARMQQWANLTAEQRAAARLTFLDVKRGLSQRQRREKWLAYQRLQSQLRHEASRASQPGLLPPGLARAAPGATTVLLSQLSKRSSTTEMQRPLDDEEVPAVGDESVVPLPTSASAPVGRSEDGEPGG
jgi:hypothetical protein